VVDGSALKVFKYTLAGSLLGSWTIDPANSHPTGITLNPNNVSDIWIVDSGTLKVYKYTAAAGRTSGSQNASATFALAPGDTNPQGIADPPPADMPLTPTATSLGLNQLAVPAFNATVSRSVPTVGTVPSPASREAVFALLVGEPLPGSTEVAVDLLAGGTLLPSLDHPLAVADRAWPHVSSSGGQRPLNPWTPLTLDGGDSLSSARGAAGLLEDAWSEDEGLASAGATEDFFARLAEDAPAAQ
jgi:hypothetical protein